MREIKFRAWFPAGTDTGDGEIEKGEMCYDLAFEDYEPVNDLLNGVENLMQFTGLKDKNGLTDIYEDDIIGVDGLVKGNKYENGNILKEKTYIVIPGITSKDWQEAHKEAMARGCKYSQ